MNDILSLFDRQLQLSIRSITNRLPKLDRKTRRKPLALDTGISRQRFQPLSVFNKS
ncbi:hypothetical protein QUA43_04955 [Microcoleus sp. N9_B4]|uniref:hypothetical protein n=1 Tax=Microcoleus sp. N9_B4 TaxID=3055386 RepID=UPI002FD1BE3C